MSVDVGALQRELAMCKMDFYKGAYGFNPDNTVGLDTAAGGPTKAWLDTLAAKGQQSIVFLGAYNRKGFDCAFERGDDWIRQAIAPIAGHPAILAYQLTDEVNTQNCPDVVAQMQARRALINSVDGSKPVYVTLAGGGQDWALFKDCADIFGLVAYPCSINKHTKKPVYNETKIPLTIQRAKDAGLAEYGAVMQLFKDAVGYYRIPTPAELQHQFDQWKGSDWRGYMLYHWGIADADSLPEHQAVIAAFNATV